MFFTKRNKKLASNIQKLLELERNILALNQENKEHLKTIEQREKAIEIIIKEKSLGFPWLANAIAEFYRYQDVEIEYFLKLKKHPAYKTADAVKEVSKEKKMLRTQLKIAQNFVNYYETLFPWINEYVGDDLDELLENIAHPENEYTDKDPVLKFIPRSEFEQLPVSERNQKALERYVTSRKRPWEIGRAYERYIGYLYEMNGYIVEYVGIEKGLEDLGRDLVCIKRNEVEIVQCKCWSSHKVIHEKHINQLYGTAVKYYIEHRELNKINTKLTLFPELISSGQIKATFVTSTKLSGTAREFATALGVKIIEEKPLVNYPLIKCNIGVGGEKIYHLPFDQQYDKTLINKKGEFYASSVREAESKGFRRAFRWLGTDV